MQEDAMKGLRASLVELLEGRGAHLDLASSFAEIEHAEWGIALGPHSLWQILEHIRIAIEDLHRFCLDPAYEAPKWPNDYWPQNAAPPGAGSPTAALSAIETTLHAMIAMAKDPAVDLFAPLAWGDGQTILRELLLAADHTSYHLGAAVLLRKQLAERR
jgi:hypothetical protein